MEGGGVVLRPSAHTLHPSAHPISFCAHLWEQDPTSSASTVYLATLSLSTQYPTSPPILLLSRSYPCPIPPRPLLVSALASHLVTPARIMFGLSIVPAVIHAVVRIWMPPSPRWLLLKVRLRRQLWAVLVCCAAVVVLCCCAVSRVSVASQGRRRHGLARRRLLLFFFLCLPYLFLRFCFRLLFLLLPLPLFLHTTPHIITQCIRFVGA